MKITLEDVREAYPNPTTLREGVNSVETFDTCYCVGGALVQYAMKEGGWMNEGCVAQSYRMPAPFLVADMLNAAGVRSDKALDAAGRIVLLNDSGDFEGAWRALGKALESVEGPK